MASFFYDTLFKACALFSSVVGVSLPFWAVLTVVILFTIVTAFVSFALGFVFVMDKYMNWRNGKVKATHEKIDQVSSDNSELTIAEQSTYRLSSEELHSEINDLLDNILDMVKTNGKQPETIVSSANEIHNSNDIVQVF